MSNRLQNGAATTQQVGSYNVYTGARYIPLIAGQWDSTKNYEPLTIVINQGNSYTSAQYVPAGIPLQTDGPYWYLTGNFNGQIGDIQSQISSINSNINGIQTDINNINGDIANIEGDIQDINDKLVTSPSSEYWLLVGDSYGAISSRYTSAWPNGFASQRNLQDNQWSNLCVDGSGFGIASASTYNTINTWHANNPDVQVTHVLIAQGANEATKQFNEVNPGAVQVANALRGWYPDVKIFLCNLTAIVNNAIENYFTGGEKLYSAIAAYNNFSFIKKGYSFWLADDAISSDGIHPTQEASVSLGKSLANAVVGGNPYIFGTRSFTKTATLTAGITGTIESTYNTNINGEYFTLTVTLSNIPASPIVANVGNLPYCPPVDNVYLAGGGFSANVYSSGLIRLYPRNQTTTNGTIILVGKI